MQQSVVHRLKRVRGQIDGLIRLVESDAECKKVVEQFSAADSALRRAVEHYLQEHLDTCLHKTDRKTREEVKTVTDALITKRR